MKKDLIYTGKAKSIYATENPNELIMEYRNDLTALNGLKKASFSGKGAINHQISTAIFHYLAQNGVNTHMLKALSPTEALVKKVDIIALEVIVRNYAAGSFSKKFNAPEGEKFDKPVFEICYKSDDLGDPMINDDQAVALHIADFAQIDEIRRQTLKINQLLIQFFDKINLILVDFKIEFGVDSLGNILLADEISPDSCRLWDKTTLDKLDKDRFRRDLGAYGEAYEEVLRRIQNAEA